MKNVSEKYVVLTEKQIVQKMAGYKSAYTKLVKSAKTARERKALEEARQSYLGGIENAIREENRKTIQRRAGHLSWITRKANQEAKVRTNDTKHVVTEKKTARTTSSHKKVCRCDVSTKRR